MVIYKAALARADLGGLFMFKFWKLMQLGLLAPDDGGAGGSGDGG